MRGNPGAVLSDLNGPGQNQAQFREEAISPDPLFPFDPIDSLSGCQIQTKRLTKFRAVVATSFQPLSIVSA